MSPNAKKAVAISVLDRVERPLNSVVKEFTIGNRKFTAIVRHESRVVTELRLEIEGSSGVQGLLDVIAVTFSSALNHEAVLRNLAAQCREAIERGCVESEDPDILHARIFLLNVMQWLDETFVYKPDNSRTPPDYSF